MTRIGFLIFLRPHGVGTAMEQVALVPVRVANAKRAQRECRSWNDRPTQASHSMTRLVFQTMSGVKGDVSPAEAWCEFVGSA